jgi:N-acetylmuramoyl-L-alanine amidase
MKNIQYFVIHCSATIEGKEISSDTIRQWHLGPKINQDGTYLYKGKIYQNVLALPNESIGGVNIKKLAGRGWTQVGYSDMIHLSGIVENLVPYDDDEYKESWEITNGVAGINSVAHHIVYVGGLDKKGKPKDTRTQAQKDELTQYVYDFLQKHPDIKIAGHNQFDNKACPSFNVPDWCKSINVPEINIYKK